MVEIDVAVGGGEVGVRVASAGSVGTSTGVGVSLACDRGVSLGRDSGEGVDVGLAISAVVGVALGGSGDSVVLWVGVYVAVAAMVPVADGDGVATRREPEPLPPQPAAMQSRTAPAHTTPPNRRPVKLIVGTLATTTLEEYANRYTSLAPLAKVRQIRSHMINAVLAMGLLAIGAGLTIYLVALLALAATPPIATFFARRRLNRCLRHARVADQYLAEGDLRRAASELRRAFHLGPAPSTTEAAVIHNLHSGLLCRVSTLTNSTSGEAVRSLAVAKVDRLLTERVALHKRRTGGGRTNAAQRAAIDVELRRNHGDIERALDMLFRDIAAAAGDRRFGAAARPAYRERTISK